MRIQSILAMSAAVIAVAACGGGETKSSGANDTSETPRSVGGDGSASEALAKLGEETKVVQDRGGSQAGSNLVLPDGFPEDVDLPANLNVISTSTPLPDTQMVMGITPSMPDVVLGELIESMALNGWTEAGFQNMTPQMTRVDFEKDSRMANVTITLNGDTSMIQLMTGPKIG